jgi:hypothetical protein
MDTTTGFLSSIHTPTTVPVAKKTLVVPTGEGLLTVPA